MRDGLLRNHKMVLSRQPKVPPVARTIVQSLCWCGADGHFGFARGGPLFCRSHVERDAAGSFHPILQS